MACLEERTLSANSKRSRGYCVGGGNREILP